jgi:DNA-binding NarL/FixJ family response regulator
VALMVGRRRKHDPLEALTAREHQVLALMAEGKSNRGIAESLGVTLAAVEKHVGRIFAKLGLVDEPLEHRRVLAVLTLLRAR